MLFAQEIVFVKMESANALMVLSGRTVKIYAQMIVLVKGIALKVNVFVILAILVKIARRRNFVKSHAVIVDFAGKM